MRFMVLVKANADSEAGKLPSTELLAAMGRFNEEMAAAGVLLAGEGLQASSKGAKILFSDQDERSVIQGPFPSDGDRLVAGFWIIRTASLDEAVAWMKRCPNPAGGGRTELEIRQVFDMEDFAEVLTPELAERDARLRAETAGRA